MKHMILLLSLLFPLLGLAIPLAHPQNCGPDPCTGITHQKRGYICGDPRLGPINRPKRFPLSIEVSTYQPLGTLCPASFLEKWSTSLNTSGSYIYPPSNGFALDTQGNPISATVTLPAGQKLDRFGSEYGSFLAPLGAPFIERSLPPSNLASAAGDGEHPFNYHIYEVVRDLEVLAGPVRPWFEMPGFGTQFLTSSSVGELVERGVLRRLSREAFDEPSDFVAGYLDGPEV